MSKKHETDFITPKVWHETSFKTDVTPAILSRDFVAQLYRATKSQV